MIGACHDWDLGHGDWVGDVVGLGRGGGGVGACSRTCAVCARLGAGSRYTQTNTTWWVTHQVTWFRPSNPPTCPSNLLHGADRYIESVGLSYIKSGSRSEQYFNLIEPDSLADSPRRSTRCNAHLLPHAMHGQVSIICHDGHGFTFKV